MKKNILKISLVIATILLAFTVMTSSSYAYTMTINDEKPVTIVKDGDKPLEAVILQEEVSTMKVEGTIEELVDLFNAYKANPGYNFAQCASNATINAKVTNMFSTDGITTLSTVLPAGAKINITPGVKDIVYTTASYEVPERLEIDFTDSIIHLPDNATVTEALKVFEDIGVASTVACGERYNITAEGSNKTTTVHLNKGEDLQAMFDLIDAEKLDNIIVAAPDYHVNLTGEENIVWLAGNLTEEEVLELVKDLRVDATVRLVENDEFSVELSVDKEPVVVRAEEPSNPEQPVTEEPAEEPVAEEKDETPKTGSIDLMVYASIVVVAIALASVVIVKKHNK